MYNSFNFINILHLDNYIILNFMLIEEDLDKSTKDI
jgi:hypothetical protein